MTLSDSARRSALKQFTLNEFEIAELTGGAGGNTFEVSSWTGDATLAGLGGNDTYAFGDDFGSVTITGARDTGTDTLDFTGHAGKLTVSPDKSTFTSDEGTPVVPADDSTLTQSAVANQQAEEIDADLPTGVDFSDIEGFFNDLFSYVDQLLDGADSIAELLNQIPFIDANEEGAIAELARLSEAIDNVRDRALSALALGDVTLSDVASELDGLTAPAGGLFDIWTFAVTTGYRGADALSGDPAGSLELLLNIDLHAEINDQTFSIDLGEEGAALGISLDVDLDVDVALDAEFSIGIATGGSQDIFLVPGGTIALTLEGGAGNVLADITGDLHLGFLDIELESGSQIELDGRAILTLVDDAVADGRIVLADILPPGGTTVADVTDFSFEDPDLNDGFLDVTANATVAAGVQVGGLDLSTATNVTLVLGLVGNPFGSGSQDARIEITSLTATIGGNPIDLFELRQHLSDRGHGHAGRRARHAHCTRHQRVHAGVDPLHRPDGRRHSGLRRELQGRRAGSAVQDRRFPQSRFRRHSRDHLAVRLGRPPS